jgi:hypothetical protein
MNTPNSRRFVRLVAGPVAAASIIGGALGLAAVANASTATIHPHTIAGATQGGGTSSTQGATSGGGTGNVQGATEGPGDGDMLHAGVVQGCM